MSIAPEDWRAKAEADFRSMNWEMQARTINYNDVVFHAQQCIEKLMKGVLAARRVPIEKTHELIVLAHLVRTTHSAWTCDPADLAAVQPGAVLLRYPGYDAAAEDAQRAIAACSRLRDSLLPLFGKGAAQPGS